MGYIERFFCQVTVLTLHNDVEYLVMSTRYGKMCLS